MPGLARIVPARSPGSTAELGTANTLAEGKAVAARDLDDEVAQAPGVVGQRRDHRGAAALAVAIQVVDAGHADVGGGRLVHARAGRADEREADRVAAEEDQAMASSSTSTVKPSTSRRNAVAGLRSATSRLGRQLSHSLTSACYVRQPHLAGACAASRRQGAAAAVSSAAPVR
jgi:hypothetical protein